MSSEGETTPDLSADAPREQGNPARDRLSHRSIYDVDSNDPRSALIDRSGVPPEDLAQIAELMGALAALRETEQRLSQLSRRYMKLNETDMRALHFLIICANREIVATPGGIAQHLDISAAATTKLLDRLEKGGHIVRAPHPTDRRALAITITAHTRRAAMETVGRQQSRRFYSAARLNREEREIVIRFLEDMTNELTLRDDPWVNEKSAR